MKNKQKLNEINSLINVRNYMESCINNYTIEKAKVKKISSLLIKLDNYLVDEVIAFSEEQDENSQE